QQRIEATPPKLPAGLWKAGEPPALVEYNELHAGKIVHQPMLRLADDPGQRRMWPGALNGAHQRHGIAYIAQRRQAQQAEGIGWLVRLAHGHDKARLNRNDDRAICRKLNCKQAQHAFYMTRRRSTDRKSTRLNSSHVSISYAVFCLKNKN